MSAPTRNSVSSKQPEQMMEIEIKFAKGKVDFVIVHFGDDAISLAKEFVSKHNLKPSSVQIIAQYIEQTIADFMAAHPEELQTRNNEEDAAAADDDDDGVRREEPEGDEEEEETPEDDEFDEKKSLSDGMTPSESISQMLPSSQQSQSFLQPSSNEEEEVEKRYSEESIDQRPPRDRKDSKVPKKNETESANNNDTRNNRAPSNSLSSSNANMNLPPSSANKYPPPSPLDHPARGRMQKGMESSSIRSIADDTVSNDTTVPMNHTTKDALDQHQFGGTTSERSSFYNLSQKPAAYSITRSSPSLSQSLLDNSQVLQRNQRSNSAADPNSKNIGDDDNNDDDNNTIDKLVEENLFSPESKLRTRSIDSKHSHNVVGSKTANKGELYVPGDDEDYEKDFKKKSKGKGEVSKSAISVPSGDFEVSTSQPANSRMESYDDYTFRSDLESLTKEQNTVTTLQTENESEDPELRYNRLKNSTLFKAQSTANLRSSIGSSGPKRIASAQSLPVRTTIRPAATSMQMGQQKLHAAVAKGTLSSTHLKSAKEKEKLIGKSVNERLYHNAELMKKKKDFLIQKNEELKSQQLSQEKFRLNEVSQRIVETISSRGGESGSQYSSYSQDIGQKLYEDGLHTLETRKKKTEKFEKLKEKFIESWSCVKCGTFHKESETKSLTNTPQMWLNDDLKYICSNCSFDNKESVLSFKPTNVGLLYNEEVKENFEKRRQKEENTSIYDHLYQLGKQHEQVLQLNRALWEDLNEKMSFKPSISEKSKAIVESYRSDFNPEANNLPDSQEIISGLALEDENLSQAQSHKSNSTFGNQPTTKLSGKTMKEYISKPTFERLTKTERRSYFNEAIQQNNKTTSFTKPTFANSKLSQKTSSSFLKLSEQSHLSEASTYEKNEPIHDKNQQDQFVNRLVYEYKEKDQKKQELANKYYKEMFKPKVSELPEELYPSGRVISSSNLSKRDIWNDILRRDQELKQERLKKQKEAIEKTLAEIQKSQVKALPASNDILHQSTQKNIDDLFKLLLISTHPLNEMSPMRDSEIIDEPSKINVEEHLNDSKMDLTNSALSEENQKEKEKFNFATDELPNKVLKQGILYSEESSSQLSSLLHDNNTVISEQQLNDLISNHLKDWKQQKLDLMLLKPNLLINEISTLLMDMKHFVFTRWQSKSKLKSLNKKQESKGNDEITEVISLNNGLDPPIEKAHPEELLISYDEFVKLALKCIRNRSGPGKAYIFAPKKKADVAIQMKLDEYSEETFKPELDKVSEAIVQKYRHAAVDGDNKLPLPIEEVLNEDGKRVQRKIEALRKQKDEKEKKDLTFKPFLYKPPSYIIPRYRGLDLSDLLEEQEQEQETLSLRTDENWNFENLQTADPFHRALVKPQKGSTNPASNITEIPGISIVNKQQPVQNVTIRGGLSNRESSSITSIAASSSVQSSSPPKGDMKSIPSISSPTPSSKSATQTTEIFLTPPHVRQLRLLDQTNFPPPPPPTMPPLAPSSSLSGSHDGTENSKQHKDDVSIFTLTESAVSIPTYSPSKKHPETVSAKKKALEKFNNKSKDSPFKLLPDTPNYDPSKSNAKPNLKVESSSVDSYTPTVSDEHSIEFPSKFSAISDLSHHPFHSSSEIEDLPITTQQNLNTYSRQNISQKASNPSSTQVRKPNVNIPEENAASAPAVNHGDSASTGGYSGNISSGGSNPEGYSRQFVMNLHPAAKKEMNNKMNNKGSYSQSYAANNKPLPLLPHELTGMERKNSGRNLKKMERYPSQDSDSYHSEADSTLSTESSTIMRSNKQKIRK